MNSNKIADVLKMINDIFPCPGGEFKGAHGLFLNKDGKLVATIWFENSKPQILCQEVVFDDEDLTERLFRNEILPHINKQK